MRIFVLSMILGLAGSGFMASGALAQCGEEGSCAPGDACGPQKSCKRVCTTKTVKKTVWVVECEDFCVPMPCFDLFGRLKARNGGACGDDCGDGSCDPGCEAESDSDNPCAEFFKRLVPPCCGKPRCRKKLVKKEIECEVPAYKCEVGYGCGDGGCCEVIEENAPVAPIPQNPTVAPVAPAPAHPLPPAPSAAMVLPRPVRILNR